jgi:transposase
MAHENIVAMLRGKYRLLDPSLNEKTRRHWAATEAMALGRGGITAVAAACGISRGVVHAGIDELRDLDAVVRMAGRIRRPGGGRKKLTEKDPGLLAALERLVEPTSRGDPESPLRWTLKSTRRLARELTARKHRVGATKVGKLLRETGYSLQANRKTREGRRHPDRDAQFRHIHRQVKSFQKRGQPVISVDTKKKGHVPRQSRGVQKLVADDLGH